MSKNKYKITIFSIFLLVQQCQLTGHDSESESETPCPLTFETQFVWKESDCPANCTVARVTQQWSHRDLQFYDPLETLQCSSLTKKAFHDRIQWEISKLEWIKTSKGNFKEEAAQKQNEQVNSSLKTFRCDPDSCFQEMNDCIQCLNQRFLKHRKNVYKNETAPDLDKFKNQQKDQALEMECLMKPYKKTQFRQWVTYWNPDFNDYFCRTWQEIDQAKANSIGMSKVLHQGNKYQAQWYIGDATTIDLIRLKNKAQMVKQFLDSDKNQINYWIWDQEYMLKGDKEYIYGDAGEWEPKYKDKVCKEEERLALLGKKCDKEPITTLSDSGEL